MFNIEGILQTIQKPITYLNNEINSIHPDTENAEVKIAIGYPDIYEVGMSNLGIRILYHILNSIDKVACERFFAPGIDFENVLRKNSIPLFTIESRKPLKDFDFVGFSISSELNYTNVLNLLSLSGIPIRSADRKEKDPIIIAGGNCSFHPESLSDFIDVWIIGEAEEAMVELVEIYRSVKGLRRNNILKALAEVKGAYVSSFYSIENNENLRPQLATIPSLIEKRVVNDFENAPFPAKWIVPLCEIIHDRISVEIMRGCPNSCLFCQGGFCWKPVRKRNADKVIEIAIESYRNTGYEEISLLSFSSGDHPEIEKIVKTLTNQLKDAGVAISFPSLRIDSFSFQLAKSISQVKRSGLTFAPETGETLRKFIGKPISDEKLINLAEDAKDAGWKQLKFYFILGLPGESDETVSEIEQLIKNLSKFISLKCSFNVFIPKPHTPFQWEKFPDCERYSETKRRLLKNLSGNRFVKLKFHPYEMSAIECLLSKGNRKLGKVIESVWKSGGKMENWSECFSFERWQSAMEKNLLDFKDYLGDNPDICNRWKHIRVSLPFDKLLMIGKNYYKSIKPL